MAHDRKRSYRASTLIEIITATQTKASEILLRSTAVTTATEFAKRNFQRLALSLPRSSSSVNNWLRRMRHLRATIPANVHFG